MHKQSFCKGAKQQLKAQYAHKLQDQYYAAMACSTPQSFPEEESFTKFPGPLVTLFGGHMKQSQSSASSATTTSIDSKVNLINETDGKLSKNSRQHQNKINQQKAQIKACKIRTNNYRASLTQNYWSMQSVKQ